MKTRRFAPQVEPELVPFLDAIAALLVAQELRLQESRRALQTVARLPKRSKRGPAS